jgi:hypothetical protein
VIVSCALLKRLDTNARHFSCLRLYLAGLDSVFGTATRYSMDGLGFEAGGRGATDFLFFHIRPDRLWVPGTGGKAAGRSFDHPSSFSAEVKNRTT